jgi:hypothetical protein
MKVLHTEVKQFTVLYANYHYQITGDKKWYPNKEFGPTIIEKRTCEPAKVETSWSIHGK